MANMLAKSCLFLYTAVIEQDYLSFEVISFSENVKNTDDLHAQVRQVQ